MTTPDTRHDDREALSALFDGELEADARRFATRRLAHDTAWQDTCGQWQMIGDAMRRQAPLAAPADFASRVARMVEAEVPATPAAPARRPWTVGRWAGGAIAASVALAAVLATSTFSTGPAGDSATPPALTAVPVQAAPLPGDDSRAAQVAAVEDGTGAPATPAVASVAEPVRRPVSSQVVARATPVEAPQRRIGRPAPVVAAPAGIPAAMQAAEAVASASNPFSLSPGQDVVSRPWPRSVLTERPAVAFTASYGGGADSDGQRPSFYPFEPRLNGDSEASSPAP